MQVGLRKSNVSQLLTNELFHRIDPEIRIKVDQGEFDPFVDIYLETDQNDPKINQNDP